MRSLESSWRREIGFVFRLAGGCRYRGLGIGAVGGRYVVGGSVGSYGSKVVGGRLYFISSLAVAC